MGRIEQPDVTQMAGLGGSCGLGCDDSSGTVEGISHMWPLQVDWASLSMVAGFQKEAFQKPAFQENQSCPTFYDLASEISVISTILF